MPTSETLLLDFMRQSPQFRIPVNQRRYAWPRRHCRQLWDNILDAHWAPYLVYNGQQRLTTITLILKALSLHLEDHTAPDDFEPDKIGSEYLVNPFGKGEMVALESGMVSGRQSERRRKPAASNSLCWSIWT